MLFHPLIQTSSRYFSRLKWVCRTQTLTNTERHISSLHSHLWVQLNAGSAFPQPDKNDKLLRFFITIIIIMNFKIFSSISSDKIPPRSACKCSQNLYQSVANHLKYVHTFRTRITSTKVFRLIICKMATPQMTLYLEI